MRILIVDDEQLALNRLSRLLTELGYTDITAATSANQALEAAKGSKNGFDAAFLDISMSGGGGIELGGELKKVYPDIFIVYQTAFDEYALKAFEVGAVDYLLKPYDKTTLKRSIERIEGNKKNAIPRFVSKIGDTKLLLTPSDIYYVKADLSETMIRSQEGFSYYQGKISTLEESLRPHSFARIHRSYIINLNKIKELIPAPQSRIIFSFTGINERIESSKEGAKRFRETIEASSLTN